jgi:hypothetical protein
LVAPVSAQPLYRPKKWTESDVFQKVLSFVVRNLPIAQAMAEFENQMSSPPPQYLKQAYEMAKQSWVSGKERFVR